MNGMPGLHSPIQGQMPQRPDPEEIMAVMQQAKAIVDGCLEANGYTRGMEDIIKSGDIELIKPVCR